ncbi:Sec20-domain-containing protein [Venturia nashicola]|nr:Sec20-domain-containing protein [Venturia nashicola]
MSTITARLSALCESHKTTLQLIQRLSKLSFQPGSVPLDTEEGDVRIELTSDIHESLKQQEEELDLLKQEVEDWAWEDPQHASHTLRRKESEKDNSREKDREREKLRAKVQVARLAEDLKTSRAQFRLAQLHAKRASDSAKRRERELLIQSYQEPSRTSTPTNDLSSSGQLQTQFRRRGPEKLTEDEILADASSDVTAALRRTQNLLSTELQRSRFAQETLDRSTAQLDELAENYSNLDHLLKSSKGLVSTLLKSQKTDTWYLDTAKWILIITIVWLFYRRIVYGPLWLFVWFPLKACYWFVGTVFSAVGLAGEAPSTGTDLNVQPSAPEAPPSIAHTITGEQSHIQVGKGGESPYDPSPDGSLSQKIGQMAEEGKNEPVKRGDGSILQERGDAPKNPKKRMVNTEAETTDQGEITVDEQKDEEEKEPVRRGDGTILEERGDIPRNPKKKALDPSVDKDEL